MVNEKNLALMDHIMNGITQAGEWDEIQTNDPMISNADARWHGAMEQAKGVLPKELYDELLYAHVAEIAATGDAGILYGIHVADVIRDVASSPADLSRYVLKRMEVAAHEDRA